MTKEDFTLQDKGKTQSIAVFAVTEPGSTPASPQPLPPGVVSNRVNHGGEQVRTATVILFDRLGFYSLGRDLSMVQDFNEDAGQVGDLDSPRHLPDLRGNDGRVSIVL